jgi:hypothetical protein
MHSPVQAALTFGIAPCPAEMAPALPEHLKCRVPGIHISVAPRAGLVGDIVDIQGLQFVPHVRRHVRNVDFTQKLAGNGVNFAREPFIARGEDFQYRQRVGA